MAILHSQVCLITLTIISITAFVILFIHINQESNNDNNLNKKAEYNLIGPATNVEDLLNSNSYIHLNQTNKTCTNIPSNLLHIENFQFLKSSKICTNGSRSPSIIILVHSAINNLMRRDIIRSTWGSVKKYKKWTIDLVFLLGINSSFYEITTASTTLLPPPDYNDNDIVIGNFIDSYHNLTYKHVMGYKWVLENCPVQTKYIIKIDDDVFLDLFHLIQLIHENQSDNRTYNYSIIGNLMSGYEPVRDGWKNEVSLKEYPGKYYPDYVSGLGYVITTEAACQILKNQNSKPYLWIDDVFVTGVLRQDLNLKIKGINSEYFFSGSLSPQFLSWYNNHEINSTTPPPWIFILLDLPELKASLWEEVGNIWFKIMRSYRVSPGAGFND